MIWLFFTVWICLKPMILMILRKTMILINWMLFSVTVQNLCFASDELMKTMLWLNWMLVGISVEWILFWKLLILMFFFHSRKHDADEVGVVYPCWTTFFFRIIDSDECMTKQFIMKTWMFWISVFNDCFFNHRFCWLEVFLLVSVLNVFFVWKIIVCLIIHKKTLILMNSRFVCVSVACIFVKIIDYGEFIGKSNDSDDLDVFVGTSVERSLCCFNMILMNSWKTRMLNNLKVFWVSVSNEWFFEIHDSDELMQRMFVVFCICAEVMFFFQKNWFWWVHTKTLILMN